LLIYINLEPYSALFGVFLILLCLAKLLNQYYYSFSGTRFSFFFVTILLEEYVYLLFLLVLPFFEISSKLRLCLRVFYYFSGTIQLLPLNSTSTKLTVLRYVFSLQLLP
jgi:hypothetical protein